MASEISGVPCMKAGNEATSYCNNSLLQKTVTLKTKSIREKTIKELVTTAGFASHCFGIADLGCASGPNTLLVISETLETIHQFYQQHDQKSPEIQVFLNDLPENDFNNLFKSLPTFYQQLGEGQCFISGTPGSFYKRLFPSKTMHFIHSSYSVHWLSQVPRNLGKINKGNIYMSKSSPRIVIKAYQDQFQSDFSLFLRLRSKEMVKGGRMILTLPGRSIPDPRSKDCCNLWFLLAKSFLELVDEGLVEAEKVDSFNMPVYTPSEEEIREIIEKEGSFKIDKLEIFEVNWDPNDDPDNKSFVFNAQQSGKTVAKYIRAVAEPMLATHFGEKLLRDSLFDRYANHVAQHLAMEKTKHINIVMSLAKLE